jgi:hypothetical protein
VPRPGDNAETPTARRPQNLQQEIHTPPQAVETDVTLSTYPHLFAQALSTSVVNGRIRCPPLGITSCGRAVDNVGTGGRDCTGCGSRDLGEARSGSGVSGATAAGADRDDAEVRCGLVVVDRSLGRADVPTGSGESCERSGRESQDGTRVARPPGETGAGLWTTTRRCRTPRADRR